MKRLNPPQVNDVAVLQLIAAYICDGAPNANALSRIQNSYSAYQGCQGDPHVFVRNPVPNDIGDRLRGRYSSPVSGMEYIRQVRYELSRDSCPMCGSLSTPGTVDHYLPQSDFPELAIFSLNLVPACNCNSLRNDVFRGASPGQRPLHPYFDHFLQDRIVFGRIVPAVNWIGGLNGDVRIDIELVDPNHASAQAIQFHLTSVVNKTNVFNFMIGEWGKVISIPNRYFGWPTNKPQTHADLRNRLQDVLEIHDIHAGTPNNWRSMLVYGILQDDALTRALYDFMRTAP